MKNPKHWCDRAKEARVHAEQITDPESKEAMLRIAEDYEKLAKRAEQRQRGEPLFQTEALHWTHGHSALLPTALLGDRLMLLHGTTWSTLAPASRRGFFFSI